jgi:hypothetical protein
MAMWGTYEAVFGGDAAKFRPQVGGAVLNLF